MVSFDCFILFSRNRTGNYKYNNIRMLNIGMFGADILPVIIFESSL